MSSIRRRTPVISGYYRGRGLNGEGMDIIHSYVGIGGLRFGYQIIVNPSPVRQLLVVYF